MAQFGKPADRPYRDRSGQKARKQLRRKMMKSAAVVGMHPQPWCWDHGILYDALGNEIIRQFADSPGKAGNPQPKPRDYTQTPRTETAPQDDDSRFYFDYSAGRVRAGGIRR